MPPNQQVSFATAEIRLRYPAADPDAGRRALFLAMAQAVERVPPPPHVRKPVLCRLGLHSDVTVQTASGNPLTLCRRCLSKANGEAGCLDY